MRIVSETTRNNRNITAVDVTDDSVALSSPQKNWYVAMVRMNCERQVEKHIKSLGIETFLPLKAELHRWSDRKKIIYKNLIPTMVFVKVDKAGLNTVNRLTTVYKMLSNPGTRKPAVIPEEQITQFKYMIGNWDDEILIEPLKVTKGTPVRVVRGSLKGLEGIANTDSEGKTKISITIDGLCNASVFIKVDDLDTI